MDNKEDLKPLTEDEIRLECLKLSVEFGPEVQRQNPLRIADKYYSWGLLDAASHMSTLNLVTSNTRNQFNLIAEYGWNQIAEGEFTYER